MERVTVIIVGFFGVIVGLAMVAILISQKANTSSIIQALASGGSSLIGTAISPVTGASGSGTQLTYPTAQTGSTTSSTNTAYSP